MSTEGRNPNSTYIDRKSTVDILKTINNEDKKVPGIVADSIEDIAKAVDIIADALQAGGRLIYVGAGTSGRMAVIDAAECYPTFGIPDGMVDALMAGGEKAFLRAIEGAEDDTKSGEIAVSDKNVSEKDVVVGISANGNAPFVLGAVGKAKVLGAKTVSIVNNPETSLGNLADLNIFLDTGEEVIKGSTRMKAGSSQKICLNMISTAVMIKLGKVYQNLMVDMRATNNKLVRRAVSMVCEVCGCREEEARKTLELSDWSVKKAIVMISLDVDGNTADNLISNKPYLYEIIENK